VTSSATPDDESSAPDGSLVVRTVRLDLDAATALVHLLPSDSPVTWLRRGQGLVGWGRAAGIRTRGATRFADAGKWWSETTASAVVHDEINEPGSGLVCFGSFAFADEPGDSLLVVPEIIVGRRGTTTWLTTISPAGTDRAGQGPAIAEADDPAPPADVAFADGALDGERWMTVVADAVARINAGDLEKVVLARDLIATATTRSTSAGRCAGSPRCTRCAGRSTSTACSAPPRRCWSAASAAWSPSRVLAGTIRRTGDDERDLALAATLARSSKDLEEHEYAVRSVADALDPHCSSMNVPRRRSCSTCPTSCTSRPTWPACARRRDGVLAPARRGAAPVGAVGGTPTPVATALIARSRHGPGQVRRAGRLDGLLRRRRVGIALRSASVEDRTVRLFAGWRDRRGLRPRGRARRGPRRSSSPCATRSRPPESWPGRRAFGPGQEPLHDGVDLLPPGDVKPPPSHLRG
jgi:menaquinone-specific isochorismate synthase